MRAVNAAVTAMLCVQGLLVLADLYRVLTRK